MLRYVNINQAYKSYDHLMRNAGVHIQSYEYLSGLLSFNYFISNKHKHQIYYKNDFILTSGQSSISISELKLKPIN